MSAKTHTKYVLLDNCGTARLASSSVTEAIEKLAEELQPTVCQELVGCTAGCLEKTRGKSLNSKDCKDFSDCIGSCQAKANQKPLEMFARKAKSPVKPKVAAKPARMVLKDTPEEENGYAKLRGQYNRLMGVHQRPPVRAPQRSPEKPTEPKEGSPEYFMAQHNRALGRPRGSCY